ncbi:MAG TPA: hypothetical protein VMI30_03285 [Stellaceae bacterium]|nr:hypothetical protein [Stellaceae bacterium]
MRLITKIFFGAAALATATAANFPQGLSGRYLGTYPQDLRKQEALRLCQQASPSFLRFLASDRDQCYREMRPVGMTAGFSGVWSKPDRQHMRVAAND